MSVQAVTPELLVRELGKVSQWDVLGTYLGVEESKIEEIERDHRHTARRRIVMFRKWFEKYPDASWEKVIDALQCMDEVRLANQLKQKYFPCATPLGRRGPLASSAPNSELTIDKDAGIVREIVALGEKYFELVGKAEAALEVLNPPPRKLKRFLQCYKQPEVQTVEELFDQQKPFYFLEYALLERMIKYFLKKGEVAEILCDYLEQLANFKSSTTVRDFMNSIEEAQQSRSTAARKEKVCTVTLRLVGGWLEKTMDDLEKLVNELFKEKAYLLSHLKIVRGSIVVTYLAPLSEADSLIAIAKTTTGDFMFGVGISGLKIGRSWIMNFHMATILSFGSSLLKAVSDDNIDLIRFLLSINTDPDGANDKKQTGLMLACFKTSYEAVALLLKANANPNLQRFDGLTALNIASQLNLPSITKALLEANADPNIQSDDGITPLMIASEVGNVEIVDILLRAKANPDIKDKETLTPLFIASQKKHTEIVGLLLKANANHNIQTWFGETPLYIASQVGHIPSMTLLLRAGADPNRRTFNGETPLQIASARGHSDAVGQLLKAKANPDFQREDGISALYIASQNGHVTTISLLLKANADPNLCREKGETPLYIASLRGYSAIVALLLEAKANCNFQTKYGITSLYIASQNGHAEIVTLLLNADADPNLQTVSGQTPLHIALQNGYPDIITLLLGTNVNPNLQASNGTTPLMSAIVFKQLQAVQLLLVKGADPNLQHSSGVTALMFACQAGYLDTVELLIKYGADPSIKSDGLTAPKIAADRGHKNIVDLLEAIKLSQSSTTSPALTANEISSKVFIDNKTMSLLNKANEEMLVKKVESFIATECKKRKEILPPKETWANTIIGQ